MSKYKRQILLISIGLILLVIYGFTVLNVTLEVNKHKDLANEQLAHAQTAYSVDQIYESCVYAQAALDFAIMSDDKTFAKSVKEQYNIFCDPEAVAGDVIN